MNNLDLRAIGNRLRQQREFIGYTRDDIAERLSVSVNFCRDIEIGAKGMSVQTLAKFSDVLKMSTDYILFGAADIAEVDPIVRMISSCKADKRKYAEDILKAFLLAVE